MIRNQDDKDRRDETGMKEITGKYISWTHEKNDFLPPFLISELHENLTHQRFRKATTQSSFKLGNQHLSTFDVYHDKTQFGSMSEQFRNQVKHKIDELWEILHSFLEQEKDRITVQLYAEFANQDFINQVKQVNEHQKEIQRNERMIRSHFENIKKSNQFDKLKPKIEITLKHSFWTVTAICKALKVSKAFLRYQ